MKSLKRTDEHCCKDHCIIVNGHLMREALCFIPSLLIVTRGISCTMRLLLCGQRLSSVADLLGPKVGPKHAIW